MVGGELLKTLIHFYSWRNKFIIIKISQNKQNLLVKEDDQLKYFLLSYFSKLQVIRINVMLDPARYYDFYFQLFKLFHLYIYIYIFIYIYIYIYMYKTCIPLLNLKKFSKSISNSLQEI